MSVVAFKSSKNLDIIYKQLKNSGINKEQSNAIIDAIKIVEREKDFSFVTKNDLQKVFYKIEKLEMKLIIKLGAMMAFWSSFIIALIKIN